MHNIKTNPVIRYPYRLIKPIANFLAQQKKNLEQKKRRISKDDPFAKIDRGEDKASPDTEVIDRNRHESLKAVKEQLEKRLTQTQKALSRIKKGQYGVCESCNAMIDTDRLTVFPETTICIKCEQKLESHKK